jgi:hypothetical protein
MTDTADRGVAIFHPERKGCRHVGRAHAGTRSGNAAIEHQPFGAPADRAAEYAQAHLAGGGWPDRFGAAGTTYHGASR